MTPSELRVTSSGVPPAEDIGPGGQDRRTGHQQTTATPDLCQVMAPRHGLALASPVPSGEHHHLQAAGSSPRPHHHQEPLAFVRRSTTASRRSMYYLLLTCLSCANKWRKVAQVSSVLPDIARAPLVPKGPRGARITGDIAVIDVKALASAVRPRYLACDGSD